MVTPNVMELAEIVAICEVFIVHSYGLRVGKPLTYAPCAVTMHVVATNSKEGQMDDVSAERVVDARVMRRLASDWSGVSTSGLGGRWNG